MPPRELPRRRGSGPDIDLASAEDEVATRALESRFDDEKAPPGATVMERLLLVQSMTIREEQRDNRARIGALEAAKDARSEAESARIKVLEDDKQQRDWKAKESEKTNKIFSQIIVGVSVAVLVIFATGIVIFGLRGGCSSIAPPAKASTQ